ncbi:MAG: hypothetical protein P8P85_10315 [Acidimicrobiales bacterium]|nr:hypothetical protein [Acidimicrobiales bacterium]
MGIDPTGAAAVKGLDPTEVAGIEVISALSSASAGETAAARISGRERFLVLDGPAVVVARSS